MQLFATWLFRLEADKWPGVSYASKKPLDWFKKHSSTGDLVIMIGANSKGVSKEDKGRIFGIAQLERDIIPTKELISIETIEEWSQSWNLINPDGELRWPHALKFHRLWKYVEPIYWKDLYDRNLKGRRFGMDRVPEHVAQKLLQMEKIEVQLKAPANHVNPINMPSRNGAPPPSARVINYDPDSSGTSYTYIFRFGKSDIWKIGYSGNPEQRLNVVNKHLPRDILEDQWEKYSWKEWPSPEKAYQIEQAILKAFGDINYQHNREQVSCNEQVIADIWRKYTV